jgi:hypothetical protein
VARYWGERNPGNDAVEHRLEVRQCRAIEWRALLRLGAKAGDRLGMETLSESRAKGIPAEITALCPPRLWTRT